VKLYLSLLAERAINALTRLFGLRVILASQSSLHSEDLTFRSDGLFTAHNVNFIGDQKFNEVIASIRKEVSHPVYHLYRIYMALKLAEQASRVPNTVFVECGVGEGIITLAINRYLAGPIPETYLIDTFTGIDPQYLQAAEMRGTTPEKRRDLGLKSYPLSDYDSVKKRFAEYPHIRLLRGSIPTILTENDAEFRGKRISFLHIDMNNAFPEYSALKYFYDKLSAPGFVLFDDYGYKSMYPQKQAIDKASVELGIPEPISLPTGQGLIIKSA